jgi:bifunctional DNA-binding transcriptional regulator/antitoxin component of YhaV-PrlF toxin-antitoxin module
MPQKMNNGGKQDGRERAGREHSQKKECLHESVTQSAAVDEDVTLNQIVKINDRGVIVIPKEIMEKMDIGRERDFLLLSIERDGKAPVIVLLPSNQLSGDIKEKVKDLKVD